MDTTPLPPKSFPPPWAQAAALLLLAVAVYLPVLSAGFIWDDDDYVTDNVTLQSAEGLWRIWAEPGATAQYYPLVFTLFWVEYRLWGLDAAGYHLVNVLLHGVAGVLLWRLLRRLEVPAAWLVAALFVVHPVQVESVAWVTERKNVLSAVFYFAAALAYLRGGSSRWYFLALLFFVAALLSKTVTCSLPAALLLVQWWKRGSLGWRTVAPLLPFFTVGLALALVTVWLEKTHVGARGTEFDLSPVDRCLIAGRALWFYSAKLVWPLPLTFIYPRWQIDAAAPWQYLFPLGVLGVILTLWLARHRLGRGPLTAVLLYSGTLVPALGFIDVYPMRFSFVADHFQYLATPALMALLVAACWRLPRRLAVTLGVACLLACGVLTWRQTAIYHDRETLWRDTLEKNPACWMAHNNLGELLFERDQFDEAKEHYLEALALNPADTGARYNLGKVLWRQGDVDGAHAAFAEAIRLEPRYAKAHYNLGLVLRRQGKAADAIGHLREAVRLEPTLGPAHNNLGALLAQQGDHPEAVRHFLLALRRDPDDADICYNLALSHARMGQLDEAVRYARQAVRRQPNEPRFRALVQGLTQGGG